MIGLHDSRSKLGVSTEDPNPWQPLCNIQTYSATGGKVGTGLAPNTSFAPCCETSEAGMDCSDSAEDGRFRRASNWSRLWGSSDFKMRRKASKSTSSSSAAKERSSSRAFAASMGYSSVALGNALERCAK